MTLRWKDWVFRLRDDGVVTVDPPLTGEEEDPLTLTIKKWEFVAHCVEVGLEVESTGNRTTCALCAQYWQATPVPTCDTQYWRATSVCDECPVKFFASRGNCIGTPASFIDLDDVPTTLTPAVAKATLYSLIALQEYLDRKESVK